MPSHAFNGCHLKPPEQYAKWKTPLATFRLPISSFSSIIACLTICLLIYHQSTHGNSTNQPHPSSCQPENNSTNLPALKTMTTITNLPAYSKDHQNRSLPDLPQATLWPCTTERCFCMDVKWGSSRFEYFLYILNQLTRNVIAFWVNL